LKNSEKLRIALFPDKFVGDVTNKEFREHHAKIITALDGMWISVDVERPPEGAYVFAIQDLTPFGRYKWVGEYFYEHTAFLGNKGDCDPYGHITHYILGDTIDEICDMQIM
jgi:hypothetical protein